MDKKPFFSGPFNPKYKDLNLFDSEPVVHTIKDFYNLKFERNIERKKQLQLLKKCKKIELKDIKFYN
jgi:hypothetical protein